MLRIISGFEKPNCGRIIYEGRDITDLTPDKIARMGIVYAHQISRPFKNLSVVENVALGFLVRYSKSVAFRKAKQLLKNFYLEDIADLKAESLSQGELKLLEVLKALSAEPKVLLLDEPFAALDVMNTGKMIELLTELKKTGYAMVITAHRMKILKKVVERTVELHEGRITGVYTPKP